jgi:hypothetical protein
MDAVLLISRRNADNQSCEEIFCVTGREAGDGTTYGRYLIFVPVLGTSRLLHAQRRHVMFSLIRDI